MSDEFRVELDGMDQIVATLTALSGFITDQLDELDRAVAALHSSSWSGVAADAYTAAHQQWAVSAREFVDGVAYLSDAAKQAHEHYSQASSTNVDMLRGG